MNKKYWYASISFLILTSILIWSSILQINDSNYKIITCDVGQGDAIIIQYKNAQILVDGGTGSRVVDCLSNHLPFWDNKIELMVLTHPQLDHFGGLIDVFENYHVERLLTSEVNNESESYKEFVRAFNSSEADLIIARENMKLRFADSTIQLLNPDPDMFSSKSNKLATFKTSRDPNDFSVTFLLKIVDIGILFTGDIGPDIIDDLSKDGQLANVDILKVPHHGSKNGLTKLLLEKTHPEIAIISVGRKNRFGHPHKEVLNLLDEFNVNILRTDEIGDIVLKTDGKTIYK